MSQEFKDLQRQIAKLNESIGRMAGNQEAVRFGPYATSYLEAKLLNPTLRAATKESFRGQLILHLVPAFRDCELGKITNPVFLAWVTEKRKTVPGFRFFNARKVLMEVLNAAKSEGIIDKTPKLDNPDEQRSVGRVLEDREVLRLLRKTKQRIFRFFFYCLWKMGCRPREILQWEWSMFVWNEPGHTWMSVPARISKTGRNREIAINPNVSRRLYKAFKSGNGSKFVFPKIGDPTRPQLQYHGAWRASTWKAKVDAMPYDFRRTFITKAAARNLSLLYVAKQLDTSTKMIEGVYAKAQADVMEEIVRL